MSSAPLAPAAARPSTASTSSCPRPRTPSPITLPASRCTGRTVGEQHLDDARGLLLHHADGHEVADADQLPVEQQHGEEGEAAAVLALLAARRCVTRERRRRERLPRLALLHAGLRERLGAADARVRRLEDLHELVVGLVLRADRVPGERGVDVGERRVRASRSRRRPASRRPARPPPRPAAASGVSAVIVYVSRPPKPSRFGSSTTSRMIASEMPVPIRNDFSRTRSTISRRATTHAASPGLARRPHAATAWRKRSASEGRSSEKWVTVPARRAPRRAARRSALSPGSRTSSAARARSRSPRRRARRRPSRRCRRPRPGRGPAGPRRGRARAAPRRRRGRRAGRP